MLKIGDFSKLARVTVKTVRHYDSIGLLRPAYVTDASYRYYSPDQILVLNRILLLRDLGFSLAEVRCLIRQPVGLEEALERRCSELQSEAVAVAERLRRLDDLRTALRTEVRPAPVLVRDIPPVSALVARERVPSVGIRITELFEGLEARAARAKVRADASPFLLFHDPSWSDTPDVEACVPIRPEAATMPGARTIAGAAKAGSITYRGPYEQTQPHVVSLGRWVESSGGRLAGPLREVYHRFGADQADYRLPRHVLASSPADYLTELQAPIETEATA